MGNKYFLSLSPSSNFRASLPQVDSAMIFNKIKFCPRTMRAKENAFWSDTRQPISQNQTKHIQDLLVGQTKGKTAENRLAKPTSGVLVTHVNPEGLGAGPFPCALTRTNLYC